MIVAKLSAAIEANILAFTIGTLMIVRQPIPTQPVVQEFHRSGLGAEAATPYRAGVVIRNETIAGLAVESLQSLHALRVLGLLYNEAKVDGDSLITFCRLARVLVGSCGLVQLGFEADRALVQLVYDVRALWYASGKLVPDQLLVDVVTHVAKASVPEKKFFLRSETAYAV